MFNHVPVWTLIFFFATSLTLMVVNILLLIKSRNDNAELIESEERFRRLAQGSFEAIALLENGKIFDANARFAEIFGYKAVEEVLGLGPRDFLDPRDAELGLSMHRTGNENMYMARSRRRDGTIFWAEIRGRQMPYHGRSIRATTIRDISERKSVEDALKTSEARYRDLFNGIRDAIVVLDSQGVLVDCNRAFTSIFGFSRDEMVGKSLKDLYANPSDFEKSKDLRSFVRQDGEYHAILHYRRKNDEIFTGEHRGYELTDSDSKPIGYFATVRDVTDRIRSEQELIEARENALAASRAKSNFLANMSHEIRTPINGVIGTAELLIRTQLEAEQQDYVETIERSAQALLVLVNDLLDHSRIEAGKTTLEQVDFDFHQLLRDSVGVLAYTAKSKGIGLDLEITADTPRYLKGDPGRIRQVFVNIVGNAIKFTEKGGVRFLVEAKRKSFLKPDLRIRAEVSDTGIGMAGEDLPRIFEPFSQVDSSITRRFGGTGLGLSISKRLLELMGGEISVRSRVGEGSLFRFSFDGQLGKELSGVSAQDNPRRRLARANSAGEPLSPPGLPILVVEDNEINLKLLTQMLAKLGYASRSAVTGRDAIEAVRTQVFGLILMDCQMPLLSGYEATRAIRGLQTIDQRHLPIVAVTAHTLPGDREKCLEAGMDDYLAKPFQIEQLRTLVEKWLLRPSPVQFSALEKLAGLASADGTSLLYELIALFRESGPKRIDELKTALNQEDFKTVARVSHGLKSSALALGAEYFSRICGRIEGLAETESRADDIQAQLKELEAEYQLALSALEKYKAVA